MIGFVSKDTHNCLTLKERQQVSLFLLKKLHEFCVHNDIKYSLAYGTLIGAVRHKGFIPWDDDVDVMMLRPYYDRFCSSFKSEGVSLYCHQNDPECFIAYARICDDVYTGSTKNSWLCGGGYTGIWIDIFPVDSVTDDNNSYLAFYHRVQQVHVKTFKLRAYLNGFDNNNSFKCNLLALLFRFWPFHHIMKKYVTVYLDKFIELISSVPFDSTNHYSQLAVPGPGSKEYLGKDLFKDYVLLDFEGDKYYAMKGYDTALRSAYGDYLQLPPKEQRRPLHESQYFYWKNDSLKILL